MNKPDWKEAKRFLALLTGDDHPLVCLQVFSDRGDRDDLAEYRHGRLSDVAIQKWLVVKIKAGCGVYYVINVTDGEGRRGANMRSTRAALVDLDGAPLPATFGLEPHIVVETSLGRYHLIWFLEPSTDFAAWSDLQARLASFYGGDAKLVDPPRVARLPGFDHLKRETFRSHVIKWPDAFDDTRLSMAALAAAHPCEYEHQVSPQERQAPANIEWDTPGNVERARAHLAGLVMETGQRNHQAYAAACKLGDLAISRDTSLELLNEWNESQADPLPEREIEHVVKSASRYRENPPGAAVEPTAEEDFAGGEDDFKKQRVIKLSNVNEHNVFKNFRVVNLAAKVRVVWWARSALDPTVRVPQFMTIPEFKNALANKTFNMVTTITDKNGKPKQSSMRVSVADYFINHQKRYTYDGVVLRAEEDSAMPDSINLWRGYGVEPNTDGDWSLMREHIRQVIAKGKEDRDRYIFRWIAWALQNADKPCEVALILKSATHGTGKGMLLRAVRKLFGAHAMQISKGGLLTGRFTAHLANTCFLFVDEMTLADNKESATLNSLLTEDAIAIEPKGIDSYMMPNHVKVAAASNQEHVVLVSGSDRRYMIFEVSTERARDHKYFGAIQAQLDAGGYGRMLRDLLDLDLGEWHPRDMDAEDDKNIEKVDSAAPEIEWLAGYLESGVLPCQVEHRGGALVFASDLYEKARRSHRGLAGWSDNKFAEFLKLWSCTRVRSGGSKWQFPLLDKMRADFRKQFPWWPAFDDATEWHDASVIEDDQAAE